MTKNSFHGLKVLLLGAKWLLFENYCFTYLEGKTMSFWVWHRQWNDFCDYWWWSTPALHIFFLIIRLLLLVNSTSLLYIHYRQEYELSLIEIVISDGDDDDDNQHCISTSPHPPSLSPLLVKFKYSWSYHLSYRILYLCFTFLDARWKTKDIIQFHCKQTEKIRAFSLPPPISLFDNKKNKACICGTFSIFKLCLCFS